ncbi:MAG: CopG family antitoxin [Anaerolineae bacterium]
MAESKMKQDPLPETFDTFEEMAEFWDSHDVTDYEEYLTPVEVTISTHPKHEYIITLSDTLDTLLRQVQQAEGVPLNTLINLWVQEKLQQYAPSLSD